MISRPRAIEELLTASSGHRRRSRFWESVITALMLVERKKFSAVGSNAVWLGYCMATR